MHEPIRILGFSAYRFIEGLVDGSIYTRIGYDADVSSNWYHLSDYLDHVRQNDRNSGSRARERIENDGWGGFVVPREHAERIIEWACDRGYEETPEQKRAREIRAEEARVAGQKARELLLSHCDEQQRDDYEKHEWFIVKGKKNRYRIRKASQINVDVLDKKGNVKYRLCTVPDSSGLPIEDQLLAQKTLIELNEKQFLDIAIRWEADNLTTGWTVVTI